MSLGSEGEHYQCLDCEFETYWPSILNDHIDNEHNEGYGLSEDTDG